MTHDERLEIVRNLLSLDTELTRETIALEIVKTWEIELEDFGSDEFWRGVEYPSTT